jgi:hypothetical protein
VRLHDWTRDTQYFCFGVSLRDGDTTELGPVYSQLLSILDSGKGGSFISVVLGAFTTCTGAGGGDDCPGDFVARFRGGGICLSFSRSQVMKSLSMRESLVVMFVMYRHSLRLFLLVKFP